MKTTALFKPLVRCAALFGAVLTLFASLAQAASAGRAPTIYAFNHSGPATINLGETVGFNWSVGDAAEISISPDIGVVTGTWIEIVPTQTTTYTLTARNSVGSVTT
ncbi:MAG: hypothetical protein V4773_23885, partial [Verrucomicrobiota bacterium]